MKTETLDHRRTGAATVAAGLLLAALVALAALAISPAYAAPMTYTVDSTADTNLTACVDATADDCTLRGAINASNANTGADTIEFEIPGAGVKTITLTSDLPAITEAVTINGYSQGVATANTLAQGNNAVLLIELNGTNRSHGLSIPADGGGSTIRGLVINRVSGDGILVNSSDNVIAGNFIGTDAAGNTRSANGVGISIITGNNNLIGGTIPAARNVISGNGNLGNVRLGNNTTPTATTIRGNHIGANASGTTALLNPGTPSIGIQITDANGVVIGGSDADDGETDGSVGARNVISANSTGVAINPGGLAGVDVDNVGIAGNFIGVDATGLIPLGNLNGGIQAITATEIDNMTIGGTAAGAGNVISGNGFFGGFSGGALDLTVQGNFVGTDLSGTSDLGNTQAGIHVSIGGNEGPNFQTLVGGGTPAERNIISGNGGDGVRVTGVNSGSASVRGNFIGTQADGQTALPNSGNGVSMNRSTAVGGTAAGQGNVISHNGGDGVSVDFFQRSRPILGNSIFSNGDLGIDLANNGVTPNDTGDPDVGPNNLQNFPVITSATTSGGNATVSGTLNSVASTDFRVEFFASTACNATAPNDFGEGKTFIGSTSVTTNGSGDANFTSLSFPVPSGQSVITSTATNIANNDTSEFSKCLTATAPANTAPVAVNDAYDVNEDASLTIPDGSTDVLSNDTDADTGTTLTVASPRPTSGPSNGTLTLNANGSFTYTPNSNFNGADSFTYKANDGAADSATAATVTITVNPVNDAPSFTKGADQTVDEDSGPQTVNNWATNISRGPSNESTQTVNFAVANNNNALFTDTGQPAISPNGTLTYTPAANANGTATVTVRLRDSGGTDNGGDDESDPQTFTITVTPVDEPPENTKPVARNDRATTSEGKPVTIDVLANDADDDALDPASVKIVAGQGPSNGATAINPANGRITYTPDNGFSGTDSFTYEVCDDGDPALCDTATVAITVNAASPSADLSVRVNAPSSVRLGQNYQYTTTTTNRGPDTAFNVASRVVVPKSVRIVNVSGTCDADRSTRVVNCKLGNMPDDAVKRFRITVKPTRAGTVQLTSVSVGSATPDPNASNNQLGQSSSGQPQTQSVEETPETTVAGGDSADE